MLNLNDEKSTPRVVETGVCWFCRQTRALTETMYVPFNFLTDKITRDQHTGNIIKHWKVDESRIPRDYLMERNSEVLVSKGSSRRFNVLETKWKYKIVNVPRCAECFRVHERFSTTYKLIKLLLVLMFAVVVGLLMWNAVRVSGWNAAFFLLVISSLVFYILLKLLGKYIYIFIKYFADSFGYNTDRRCQNYPEVLAVAEQGWKLGENPDVIPESYSI